MLSLAGTASAQVEYYKEREDTEAKDGGPSFWDRTYYGGNFSLQFGNFTFVDISPLMGYMLTEKLSAGVGGTYQYYRYDIRGFKFSGNTYGGRVFSRYNITPQFFAHGEVEQLNLEFVTADFQRVREWVPGVFIGGGYFAPFNKRGGFQIMALYNLAYDEIRSPYGSPIIFRVGFVL